MTIKAKADVTIRWMIRRDMAEVLRIEQESFEFNWTEEDFQNCLRLRNCIGMVAEIDNRVVGFMIYELHKTKLHILNFAAAEFYRKLGVGTAMVEKLVNKLSQQRRREIVTLVREKNMDAQLFFRAMGFRARTVVRGHYADSGEDAYLMSYVLAETEAEAIEATGGVPVNRIKNFMQLPKRGGNGKSSTDDFDLDDAVGSA